MRNRAFYAELPRAFVPAAVAGIDVNSDNGLVTARLRMALDLVRNVRENALLAACRAHGLRHVLCGHQAAFALAALAIPVADRRH